MLPKVSISIDIAEMQEAIQFYSKALACKIDRDDPAISVLSAENVTIYLLLKSSDSNPLLSGSARRNFARHWTPVHLDFSVVDLQQTLSLVLQHGGSHEGTETADWGSIAYCADPFGNGFCIVKS